MIKFKKYRNRIDNLEIRNTYSSFELVKYYDNDYYNKYEEYINNGYELSFGGEFLTNSHTDHNIDIKFFNLKECCFVIGFFNLNIEEPEALWIDISAERLTDLNDNELINLRKLIKKSTKYIIKEIYKIKNK